MHPGGNRQTGNRFFNQLVSERFFALHGLIEKLDLKHAVHLENDNMVYGDMRPMVETVARCGHRLASTFGNTRGVIPGIVYVRDAAAIRHLCDFINDFLSCGKLFGVRFSRREKDYGNDMTYMMSYYELYGSRYLGALPAWEHRPHENCIFDLFNERRRPEAAALGGSKFIFDLASFGQWYSFSVGKESPPRHVVQSMRGRFIDPTPPPKMTWARDTEGRRIPKWKEYILLSLHVHAKNLALFSSDAS
jgi:hypothetical protein